MKKIRHHYKLWEDWQGGMYSTSIQDNKVADCEKILGDAALLLVYMQRVVDERQYATEYNLSDNSINKKAYLGQSACNIYCGSSFMTTCTAWRRISPQQRIDANKSADKAIFYFKKKYYSRFSLFDI